MPACASPLHISSSGPGGVEGPNLEPPDPGIRGSGSEPDGLEGDRRFRGWSAVYGVGMPRSRRRTPSDRVCPTPVPRLAARISRRKANYERTTTRARTRIDWRNDHATVPRAHRPRPVVVCADAQSGGRGPRAAPCAAGVFGVGAVRPGTRRAVNRYRCSVSRINSASVL